MMQISGIDKENAAAFAAVMPAAFLREDILSVGVVEEDKAVAAVIICPEGESALVEYLYVLPEYRRRGIGSFLLREALRLLDVSIVQCAFAKDTDGMEEFCSHLGLMMVEDTDIISIPMPLLKKRCATSSLFSRKPKLKAECVKELGPVDLRRMAELLWQEGFDTGLLEEREYVKELSFVCRDPQNKKFRGVLLCDLAEETLLLSFLLNVGGDPEYLLALFRGLLDKLESGKYDDADLRFVPAELSVRQFAEKLAGDALAVEGRMVTVIGRLKERDVRSREAE